MRRAIFRVGLGHNRWPVVVDNYVGGVDVLSAVPQIIAASKQLHDPSPVVTEYDYVEFLGIENTNTRERR